MMLGGHPLPRIRGLHASSLLVPVYRRSAYTGLTKSAENIEILFRVRSLDKERHAELAADN